MRRWSPYVRVRVLLASAVLLACGEDLGPRIPAAIVIVPNAPRIPSGESRQLTATVVDAAGREIDGVLVTFHSTDTTIVTVNAAGLLTAVGPLGSAIIAAAAGELTGQIEAEVVLAPSAVLVTPASLELNRGESAYLSVIVTDEDSEIVPNPVLTFQTSNPLVASVDQSGLVTTGSQLGTATITVASGERQREVTVTVAQIPTSLTLAPTNIVLAAGGTRQLAATVLDRAGTPIAGAAISWSSSDADVVTVTSTGLVRSVGPEGSANIIATSGVLSASVGVFVGEAPAGTILATVPVDWAWGVTVTEGGRYLVAATDNRLVTGTLPDFAFPVTIPVNTTALDVVVNQAATRAYVAGGSNESAFGIGVVDLATNTMVDVLPVPQGVPLSVALSADESKVIVGTDIGFVVVDIASKTAEGATGTGSINTITRHPTQPLLYATVYGSAVLEIDAQTGAVSRTLPISGAPQGNAVSPDGTRLYVADEASSVIHVRNLETGAAEPSFTSTGGFGMAISPDGEFLYLAAGAELRIVDRASGTLVRTVSVGGNARRIAFSSGGVAVVTNEGGWVDFVD
jgi:DNA-binding beta-propeller fold protein YncE/uncharacterized protein YjdB